MVFQRNGTVFMEVEMKRKFNLKTMADKKVRVVLEHGVISHIIRVQSGSFSPD